MGVNFFRPLLHKKDLFFIIFRHEYMCMHTRECVNLKTKSLDLPGAGVSGGFEPPYMGPLQVQYALLTLISEHLKNNATKSQR